MTLRALIFGFLGAIAICAITYFNDYVIDSTFLVGSFLPLALVGFLILFLITVNPLLQKVRPNWSFRGSELAVITGLSLVACGIPSSGHYRNFTAVIMMPHHEVKVQPGWQFSEATQEKIAAAQEKAGGEGEQKEIKDVVDYLPERMLADPEGLDPFVEGMARGDDLISLQEIPWETWSETLTFWLPTILALWIALLGLSLVVHSQWSNNEHLPYPIARVLEALFPSQGDKNPSPLLSSRIFWVGLGVVLFIHFNNFLHLHEVSFVRIPLDSLNFRNFLNKMPQEFITQHSLSTTLHIHLYFSAIAIAYFLPKDISFSVGAGPIIFGIVSAILLMYGVSVQGDGIYSPASFFQVGAFFGIMLMVLYTGRFFYANVLRRALGFGKGVSNEKDAPIHAVWGARVFMAGTLLFMAHLGLTGLDWQLIVIYTICLVTTFLVLSRILAETGAFTVQIMWSPAALIVSILGVEALGPQIFFILILATFVLMADPREAIMPFIVNGLKLGEMRRIKVGKMAMVMGLVIVVCLGVGLVTTLFWQYNYGQQTFTGWTADVATVKPGSDTLQVQQTLEAQGKLAEAGTVSGWQRFGDISPKGGVLFAFGLGITLVVLFSFARLRFTWWPIHPIAFAMILGWPGYKMAASFLIGWLLKMAVTKYGGEKGYTQLKPLIIGLLAGELLGAFLPAVIAMVYFFITGQKLDIEPVLPT